MRKKKHDFSEILDKVAHVRSIRVVSDRQLTEGASTNLSNALLAITNWINDECNCISESVDAINPFCEDNISRTRVGSLKSKVGEIQKDAHNEIEGIFELTPGVSDIGMKKYFIKINAKIHVLTTIVAQLQDIRLEIDDTFRILEDVSQEN